MLLFHYIVTLATCCCQLYIVILRLVPNPNLTNDINLFYLYFRKAESREMLASFIYNLALYVEFGYYAFPADILVSEVGQISSL